MLRAFVLPREGGLKPRLSHVHTPVMRAGDHYGWQPIKTVWLGLGRGDFLKGKEGGCCFQNKECRKKWRMSSMKIYACLCGRINLTWSV